MSYGIAFISPLPTPGVTASPTFEAQLIAREQEIEAKLVNKVTENDIAVSTGDLKTHGTRPLELPAAAAVIGTGVPTFDHANEFWAAAAAGNILVVPLAVQPGQRITLVAVHGRNSGVAWTLTVHRIAKGTGTVTLLGTVNSGAVAGTIEKKSIALTEVVADDSSYVAKWTSGAAADRYLGARLEVDRP